MCGQNLLADDAPAVAAFANHLAIALDNARLFAAKQQAYEQLQVSEEKYRAVVQLAADAIVLANAKGAIIAWNAAAQAIFGYEEVEILGQPVTRLMPEPARRKQIQAMADLQAIESDRQPGGYAPGSLTTTIQGDAAGIFLQRGHCLSPQREQKAVTPAVPGLAGNIKAPS